MGCGDMRIEYGDDDLRRLAEDQSFRPRQWGPDLVRAYRKKIQIIQAAKDEQDLRALRSLRLEQLKGNRAGTSSIRLNDQFRLILTFKTDGERVAVVLELVDYH
jgi:proteic killer suppression protein